VIELPQLDEVKPRLDAVMEASNETGVVQPIDDYAAVLSGHSAYFHVDAAQGFVGGLAGGQDGGFVGDVQGHRMQSPDLGGGGLQALGVQVPQADLAALGDDPRGHGLAQARGPAGDHRRAARKAPNVGIGVERAQATFDPTMMRLPRR